MKNFINLKLAIHTLLLLLFISCTDDDPIQFKLTTKCLPENAGAVSPKSIFFTEGSQIELKASPNPEYIFKNWEGDASGNQNPMTISIAKDLVITAVFEKVTYSLNIEVIGEGTVNQEIVLAKESSTDYESGTTILLTAVPEDEWVFVEWSGDHTSTDNPVELTMNRAKTITAKFEKKSYPLNIEIEGKGTVMEEIVPAKTSDYPVGTKVMLTAKANEGWAFEAWSGDHQGTENPITLTIDKEMAVTATFEPENLDKTYIPDDNFEKALIDLDLDNIMDDYVYTYKIKDLETLEIPSKQIEDLTGIEDFISLETLVVDSNKLNSIDISKNEALIILGCHNNNLASLDISANLNLMILSANDNPLNCIQVNDEQLQRYINDNWPMWPMFSGYYADDGVVFSTDCNSVNGDLTYIPDNNFELALINLGYDDVLDDHVLTSNIENITELNLHNQNISDLSGIEDFTQLESLDCSENQIASINLNENIELKELIISGNSVESLDLSQNSLLERLNCDYNPITLLDLTKNPKLRYLRATDAKISSIDLNSNPDLEILWLSFNQLSNLDLSSNTNLKVAYLHNNLLNNLNLNGASSLEYLECSENQLSSLDLNFNSNLRTVNCGRNPISTINLKGLTKLDTLDLYNHKLSKLNLSSNTGLTEVNCSKGNLTELIIDGAANLKQLSCSENSLEQLDLKGNSALTLLVCWGNKITSLDISKNVNLVNAWVDNNELESFITTGAIALEQLDCSFNKIKELDFSTNTSLNFVGCESNLLESLNLKNGNNQNIFEINVLNNPSLTCIQVDDAIYATTNWKLIDPAASFSDDCDN